jgi:hypothetical protein
MRHSTSRCKININNFSSLWESLPSLNPSRSGHWCDRIFSGQTRYLVVYGGHHVSLLSPWPIYGDILFLDMNRKSEGWFSIPGIQLNKLNGYINGGLIKQLNSGT